MNLQLIFAFSLVVTFLAWYVCGAIPGWKLRGVLRATLIALLCSPGVVVGHGFAVVPSLFALSIQPSVFTIGPMLVVWIIALGVIFTVPALRNHRSAWPPSAKDVILTAYPAKFAFFGIIAAVLMLTLNYADQQRAIWVLVLQHGLVFGGAVINLALCRWATRARKARPFVTPLAFALPAFLAAPPVVPLIWYSGGAIGGLIGSGRSSIAAGIALGLFAFLLADALFRTYSAATAAAHVVIQGGVVGNAAMAALYSAAAIVAWRILKRLARAKSGKSTTPPRHNEGHE